MTNNETPRPSEFDFNVAENNVAYKEALQSAEHQRDRAEALVRDRIADAAAGDIGYSETADDPEAQISDGEKAQEKLVQAQKEVDMAFDDARQHYQSNADQYVVNAHLEKEAMDAAQHRVDEESGSAAKSEEVASK